MALGKIQLKKSESILVSAVAASMIFVFFSYWLKPKKAALNKLLSEVKTVQKQVEENQNALVTLKNKAPASVELKTSNELLDKYMKSNDRFSNVVARIVDETVENDFTVHKIATESSADLYGYSQTLYNIEAESSFIGIGEFLEGLEDSSLLTEIKSIEINRTPNELKVCKATIKLFSYVSGAPGANTRIPASAAPAKDQKEPSKSGSDTAVKKPETKT